MNIEQIKNLKYGDLIVINATFMRVDVDGDIRFNGPSVNGVQYEGLISPECVSIPTDSQSSTVNSQSKYDPTRLFKKGDRVTPKEVNGRHPGNRGVIFRVCQDEEVSGREIKLALDGHIGHITIDAAYLQLVTPIEELEPYIIREYADFYAVEKDGAQYSIFFNGSYHDNAKAAAAAERDRLNAEWRKERAND